MGVKDAIEFAVEEQDELTDVIVLGHRKDGTLYVRSSRISREGSLWLALELQDWVRKVGRYE
jgi:hypothetical protein